MNILIASPIDPTALERLRAEHDVKCAFGAEQCAFQSAVRDREVIVFRSGVTISSAVMQSAPRLELLVRAGSGCDNVDLEYVKRRGLRLVRVPQPAAKAVAELAFAQMLVLARNLLAADRSMRQGEWRKGELTGFLLTGKVLGIVGAGNIGSRVGQLGAAWGMEVLGCVEFPSAAVSRELAEKGICLAGLDEVLRRADFLSLHVPLQDSTRYLINAEALARMKQGAFLVNTSRGGIVDEEALRHALQSGHLRGAALDVHEREGEGKLSPLASLPNVLLSPHIGSSTVDTQREIGQRILDIINQYVADRTRGITARAAS
ncbi:MAG: hydroxyacid dehydrogenase [Planctomycetes bacterium RBG_16_64_12]|nr:MAG: hydroxyacid dehydrogenase [Planctomycetes bacterium RBG_16_64_12]